jgi:hypothetical protein
MCPVLLLFLALSVAAPDPDMCTAQWASLQEETTSLGRVRFYSGEEGGWRGVEEDSILHKLVRDSIPFIPPLCKTIHNRLPMRMRKL